MDCTVKYGQYKRSCNLKQKYIFQTLSEKVKHKNDLVDKKSSLLSEICEIVRN